MWSVCLRRTSSSVTNCDKTRKSQQTKDSKENGVSVSTPITRHQISSSSLQDTQGGPRLGAHTDRASLLQMGALQQNAQTWC
jgi:hypothetical protein